MEEVSPHFPWGELALRLVLCPLYIPFPMLSKTWEQLYSSSIISSAE